MNSNAIKPQDCTNQTVLLEDGREVYCNGFTRVVNLYSPDSPTPIPLSQVVKIVPTKFSAVDCVGYVLVLKDGRMGYCEGVDFVEADKLSLEGIGLVSLNEVERILRLPHGIEDNEQNRRMMSVFHKGALGWRELSEEGERLSQVTRDHITKMQELLMPELVIAGQSGGKVEVWIGLHMGMFICLGQSLAEAYESVMKLLQDYEITKLD